jgi:hypothetical protein
MNGFLAEINGLQPINRKSGSKSGRLIGASRAWKAKR